VWGRVNQTGKIVMMRENHRDDLCGDVKINREDLCGDVKINREDL
jgi:hypothetical protein